MRIIVLVVFIGALLSSCTFSKEKNSKKSSRQEGKSQESIVEHEVVSEIIGDGEKVRILEYTIVSASDTSSFIPRFRFSTKDSLHYISLQLSDIDSKINYSDIIQELDYVLEEVANDNDISSLKRIFVGRLALLGDKTVEISETYFDQFGTEDMKLQQGNKLEDFILNSSLSTDLNELLSPYNLRLKRVHLDQVSFLNREQLPNLSSREKGKLQVPNLLLDAVCSYDLETIK